MGTSGLYGRTKKQVSQTLRQLGWINAGLYALDRLLAKVSKGDDHILARMSRPTPYPSLTALPAGASRVFEQAARHSVYFSKPWFENYISTVIADQSLIRIYSAGPENAPSALLPMQVVERGRGLLAPRTLQGLENYYSSLFGPLLGDHAGAPEIRGLVQAIRDSGERWDMLDFHPLSRESVCFDLLIEALRGVGYLTQPFFCFGNWYLEVNGRSFAEYFEALPSQLKNTIKRKRKQLESGGTTRFEIIRGGPELEPAIADFVAIYNSSWKKPEPYPDFIPGLIRTCAREGWLRLGIAHCEGVPAAAQIWIVQGGTASIYKLAYDERFARMSIGSVLTAHLMREAIDVDRVDVVDYLTGDDAYKKDWMSHRRERWGIVAFNPRSPRGLAAAARHYGGQYLKRLRAHLPPALQSSLSSASTFGNWAIPIPPRRA
jgi:CelD/BcsL family acetyltransferase involved in cellulose biosynthesis